MNSPLGDELSKGNVIVCGGINTPPGPVTGNIVRLNLHGSDPNVTLKIGDISRRMAANIPPELLDLLEIAAYVYAGDQAVIRGNNADKLGADWRRHLIFHIPVRKLELWSSESALKALKETLGFLSDDEYEFMFTTLNNPPAVQLYFEFGDSTGFQAEEVVLFSGGLDSLGGVIQEAVLDKKKIVMVSHRSEGKIDRRQKDLAEDLRGKCATPPFHVQVWVNKQEHLSKDYMQRTRSFLYASLAAVVARLFGLWRIRFYENGVVSINLPISAQVVGSRATRTTHPQVLNGFAELFTTIFKKPFAVQNHFQWKTKSEVTKIIRDAGCGSLIRHTMSCTRTKESTKMHSHCGVCSQCIDRRFATLAAGCPDEEDPKVMYRVDLLTGERPSGDTRTMVESYVRTAKKVKDIPDLAFFEHFPETSRAIRHLKGLTADAAASNILDIYKRHALEVDRVLIRGFKEHAQEMSDGTLPASCLLILALPEEYKNPMAGEKEVAVPPDILCSYGDLKSDRAKWERYFRFAATLDNDGKVQWIEGAVKAHWQDKQKAELIGMHQTTYSSIANRLFPQRPNRRRLK